jgi:uncharacterized protein (TIGR03435 family)
MPAMLQTALADRFQLVIRRASREIDGLALMVAGSHKLKPSSAGDVEETRGGGGQIVATKMTMTQLASTLARAVRRPVADRTGPASSISPCAGRPTIWTPTASHFSRHCRTSSG